MTDTMKIPHYKISTITAIGRLLRQDVKVLVNLQAFYDSVVEGGPFQYTEYTINKDNVFHKGYHKKMAVKMRREKTTKRFDNQVSVLFCHHVGESTTAVFTNMKIFQNGNVQMTGLKSIEQGHSALEYIANHIRKSLDGWPIVDDMDMIEPNSFKICMINSDFKLGVNIKRNLLYNIVRKEYGTFCRFEPTCYAGVAIQPMINELYADDPNHICRCTVRCDGKGCGVGNGHCKRVTIAVFGSGAVIITGSQSIAQLDAAYEFITRVFTKHSSIVCC